MEKDITKFDSLIDEAENGVIKISRLIDVLADMYTVRERKIVSQLFNFNSYFSGINTILEGIRHLSLNGVNKFVFDEPELLDKTHLLFPRDSHLKYTEDVYYIGTFTLKAPIDTGSRKSCSHIYFDGIIKINNYLRSKEIELPENFHCINVYANKIRDQKYIFYGSVSDYVNRPERLQRLIERREEKRKIDNANKTGILLLTDRYGIPLEVGCTVVRGSFLCEVEGQKKDSIILRPYYGSARYLAAPAEIMRIH